MIPRVLLILSALFFSGCFAKADPAPRAGFAEQDAMFYSAEIPFHKVWWDPDTDFSKFKKIYIAPVNTDHLLKMNWWQEVERGKKLEGDLPILATYTRNTFRDAFQKDPKRRFQVVDFPYTDALVLKIALVEVIPTKTSLKAAGLIPPLMIPMKIAGLASPSSAAFEARMELGTSEKVVAMFADRENAKISIINLKDFSWYGHAKALVKEWSKQFVEVCHKERYQVVKDSSIFELKPW